MSERTLRWGILSTANIGRRAVTPAIQSSSNGCAVAVASRDKAKARAYADELGLERAYGSYEALLGDDEVDAVYIALPNSLHKEWTVRAAEGGKHVLCEKPLGLNAQECFEMNQAARVGGVKLMEAFMYRFHPRTQEVITRVRRGDLGALSLIRSSFTFKVGNENNIRLQSDLGGGSLMDVGCYCVNISRTLAGAEPVQVQAFATWGSSGVDNEMVGTLVFPGDVFAHFHCALTLPRQEFYEVRGEAGSLHVPAAFLPGTEEANFSSQTSSGEETHRTEGADEYQLMVEHFADCVLHDKPLRYDATEAAANMRVIDALYASARAARADRPKLGRRNGSLAHLLP